MQLSSQMTNIEIADMFREVAAVYTVQGVEPFRTAAYLSAAASIEQFPTPLREMWQAGQLEEVPGIGEKFCTYLSELFETGHIQHFEKMMATEPAGMFPLLDVPGIGPKTAVKLATTFQLKRASTALQDVLKAAHNGKIATLPGFSEVSQEKIKLAIEQHLQPREHRMLISEAWKLADEVMDYLKKSPATLDVEALGSLRRRASTVGDVDIAVKTSEPNEVMKHVLNFPKLGKLLSTGEKTTMFLHQSGWEVDIKTQSPERWGSMLQHYTGSKLHNIKLRTFANAQGLSLSENGIKKGDSTTQYTSEEAFYHALGLEYIPPELREDQGEIEAAKQHKLPKLVELSDIKGDLHMHCSLPFPTSHDLGESSVTELLHKAMELGYAFIGISDHNPRQHGLTAAERLKAVKLRNTLIDQEVEAFVAEYGDRAPRVYKGLEIDILPSGELALEDDALELLDYAIVSIHSQFHPTVHADDPRAARAAMTQRILNALAHPKVKIFGHPTARKIPTRSEIECDWDQVFTFMAEHHQLVEVNASPDRLDLPFPLIQRALSHGLKLVIDTDSHHSASLDLMKYGVWTARKGWATKRDVANTRSSLDFDS